MHEDIKNHMTSTILSNPIHVNKTEEILGKIFAKFFLKLSISNHEYKQFI